MPAEQPTTDPLAGHLVGGRYRLIRRIGKGGMGVVYEADHVGLDKRVAVKFLLDRFTDDPEVVERFHREARTASRIGHENIIQVFDVGTHDDGRPYLVMELLDGTDLAVVLERSGPMPAARAVHLIRQVLRGLGAAHDKGIVHRDMKPENVFVVRRGDDADAVTIMDFGISKVIAANESKVRLTATGAVIGTPVYMAPEQALAQAELDHRVDLYAVGVMLFELLAGRPPFMATNYLGLVTQHLQSAPPSLAALRPDLPAAVVAAVHRALEKDPARRFQSAAEMARALPDDASLRALDGSVTLGDTDGVRAVTPGAGARAALGPTELAAAGVATGATGGRGRWIAIAAAVAVAGGMVAVAIAMRGGDDRGGAPAGGERATEPVPDRAPAPAPGPTPELAPGPEVVSLGKLDVVTVPAGARVFLDGTYKGDAPILLGGIAAGTHDLRLERDGHQTVSLEVVVGGGTTTVREELPRVGASAPPGGERRPPRTGTGAATGGGSRGGTTGAGTGGDTDGAGGGATSGGGATTGGGSRGGTTGTGGGNTGGSSRPGQKPNPYD